MFLAKGWEYFHTDSDYGNHYVSRLFVDCFNKKYILKVDAKRVGIDLLDADREKVRSHYVSKALFEMLVNSVKDSGFRESLLGE